MNPKDMCIHQISRPSGLTAAGMNEKGRGNCFTCTPDEHNKNCSRYKQVTVGRLEDIEKDFPELSDEELDRILDETVSDPAKALADAIDEDIMKDIMEAYTDEDRKDDLINDIKRCDELMKTTGDLRIRLIGKLLEIPGFSIADFPALFPETE